MSNLKADVQESIDNVNAMKLSHIGWAEHFKDNPDIEKEYVATGKWDSAKTHREYVMKYDKILDLLKLL